MRVCCFRRRVGGRLAGRLRLDDGGPRRGHRAGRRRGRFGLFARRWVERGGGNGQVGRARGRSRGTLGRNERPRGAGKRREARGGRAGRVTVRNFARRDALGRASRASDPSAHVPSRRALRLLRQRSPSSPRPVLRRRTSRPLSRVVARRPVGCVGCAFSSDATRAGLREKRSRAARDRLRARAAPRPVVGRRGVLLLRAEVRVSRRERVRLGRAAGRARCRSGECVVGENLSRHLGEMQEGDRARRPRWRAF